MFNPKKSRRVRSSVQSFHGDVPVPTRSLGTIPYGNFLTPHKHESSEEGSAKSSRRSSIDLTTHAYYSCDEPEIQHHAEVQAIQDVITEVVMQPAEYPFKLYISGLKAANDLSLIQEHNIKAVLSLGTDNAPGHFSFVQAYLNLDLPNSSHNIAAELSHALAFLDYELSRHNVLVHCYFGVNRSVAVITAFLMKTLNLTCSEALLKAEEARRVVMVSDWLLSGLDAYELELSRSRS
jgi:protein-tyrosine phosphatase